MYFIILLLDCNSTELFQYNVHDDLCLLLSSQDVKLVIIGLLLIIDLNMSFDCII